VAACATAIILTRASHVSPGLLAAMRLLGAAVALAPFWWWQTRQTGSRPTWSHLGMIAVPGILLWLHFVTWAWGGRLVPAAHATILGNLAPAAMPLVAFALLGERPVGREMAGTILCLGGVLVLAGGGEGLALDHLLGDGVCLGSMLLFTAYLALGRRHRASFPHLILYLVPLYAVAGLVGMLAWVVAQVLPHPPVAVLWTSAAPITDPWREAALLAGVAVVPTVLGHGILNWGVRTVGAQVVSLVNLTQFLFAGAFAWLLWHEIPTIRLAWAAPLICGGIAVALTARRTP
jgi:drug/metabolite transporter (DMT)-like permease